MSRYIKELKKIMSDDAPAKPTTRTRAEIETAISEISTMLKKPLDSTERLRLVADRRDLRKQLEATA